MIFNLSKTTVNEQCCLWERTHLQEQEYTAEIIFNKEKHQAWFKHLQMLVNLCQNLQPHKLITT